MRNLLSLAATVPLAFTLAACATDGAADMTEMPVREPTGECNADPVQYHIGHTASAGMGQAMLTESGARQLRWVPPRTAVTMDYRPDRLTVSYDDDLVIERVSCG
ncbi:I78 family peptidase inhibitor [Aurantiacibacter sp. MUD61]|uniref:I78 family peptidase inhibitor n=1 Tax=Aurantiacibacter sp. MUD61 TaxID=3009083 RepID=UPI0022F11ACF|nr:I78 family peptidase inhibitor [Aurantiacibacter sp. MUD61]